MEKDTNYPKVVFVEAVLMDNREVISMGQTLGFVNKRQQELVENGACKIAKGGEAIIHLGENTA